jgi:hypothetical protein
LYQAYVLRPVCEANRPQHDKDIIIITYTDWAVRPCGSPITSKGKTLRGIKPYLWFCYAIIVGSIVTSSQ